MATCTWESVKADASTVVEKLRSLVHEGNVRRVVVTHEGRTVAEFPLTAGVVGAVIAPVLAAALVVEFTGFFVASAHRPYLISKKVARRDAGPNLYRIKH